MICLGTLNFGTTLDQAEAFGILDRFVAAGGKLVDTANCYDSRYGTGDESELVLGAWHRSRGNRAEISLATKVGGRSAGAGPEDLEGLSAAAIRAAAEDSLRRLGTDHLDVYYAHVQDDSVPQEETLGAFEELIAAGKVVAAGLSNQSTDSVRRARESAAAAGRTPVTCLQQRYSYLQPMPGTTFGLQKALTADMIDYVRTQPDLTVLGYSPLMSGAYTRPDRRFWPHYGHPDNEARLVALYKVAGDLGVSPNQVVLAWMLAATPAVHPVIGVSSVAQLDECLAAGELVLGDEHLRCLDLRS